jgi:environmental stress-induced protein Ves
MEITVIQSKYLYPSSWSGGTTTELYIFPKSASYQKRDFLFRLSTATVEAEECTFTSLPSISRKLMILSGSIVINHKGHYSKQLNKFDIDEFEGDWETLSKGQCTDFNLMTNGKTRGELKSLIVEKEQLVSYTPSKLFDWVFIYLFSGNVSIEIASNSVSLNKGDFLAIERLEDCDILFKGLEDSELVISEIVL